MPTHKVLNTEFAIQDQLHFETNASGIVMAVIENQYAKMVISTYGAHIVSYLPKGETEDVFYLSELAVFGEGKAIRGGIPICWPWFADDKSGYGRPAHGFARNVQWVVLATGEEANGNTTIQLGLNHTDNSLAVWPHPFELVLDIVVGEALTITLTTKNISKKPVTINQAFHTYFNVSDIEEIEIQGLDNVAYLNKLTAFSECKQHGNITVQGEIDRVYTDVPKTITLCDKHYGRDIVISGQGSNTTVVWNPGPETIKPFKDLPNSDYQSFICIETANALHDIVTLAEGESHSLTANYQVNKQQV
jgi:glucose-6-phosphate 1-epimerase